MTDSHIIGGSYDDKKHLEEKAKANDQPQTAKEFLQKTKLNYLFPEGRTNIVYVDKSDPVAVAFKKLIDNHILSVPVHDSKHDVFIGFIDMLDIVCHCLKDFQESELKSENDFEKLLESHHTLSKFTCDQVAGSSGRTPFYPVEENAPLLQAIQLMNEKKAHRLPVVDSTGRLVSLISQSLVISLITNNLRYFPFVTKTVEELKLGYKDVVSISTEQSALTAFQEIYNKKILGVAVVDENGVLVGNISASDLKQIGKEAHAISRLLIPAARFIELIPKRDDQFQGPYAVQPSATIEEVLMKITMTKSHRVFVVDTTGKPVGVISLVDLLEVIVKNL